MKADFSLLVRYISVSYTERTPQETTTTDDDWFDLEAEGLNFSGHLFNKSGLLGRDFPSTDDDRSGWFLHHTHHHHHWTCEIAPTCSGLDTVTVPIHVEGDIVFSKSASGPSISSTVTPTFGTFTNGYCNWVWTNFGQTAFQNYAKAVTSNVANAISSQVSSIFSKILVNPQTLSPFSGVTVSYVASATTFTPNVSIVMAYTVEVVALSPDNKSAS